MIQTRNRITLKKNKKVAAAETAAVEKKQPAKEHDAAKKKQPVKEDVAGERKIENKIIEAVSEELARRAFKPIDQAIDSLMREKYQDSINRGKPVDWEKAGESYAAFLAGMNKAVDLPEKYTFDVTQEVEIVDYSNKSNKIRMYYSKSDAIMGIEDLEQKDTKQLIVMDISRDAMIIYTTDKKGEKTGQVVPSVMKMASSLAGSVKQDTDGKDQDMKIEKTGKKKHISIKHPVLL